MVTHPRGKNPGLAVRGPGVKIRVWLYGAPGVASLVLVKGTVHSGRSTILIFLQSTEIHSAWSSLGALFDCCQETPQDSSLRSFLPTIPCSACTHLFGCYNRLARTFCLLTYFKPVNVQCTAYYFSLTLANFQIKFHLSCNCLLNSSVTFVFVALYF